MPNIVLEQNGVNNTNIDGARFNYFSAGQQNGVIDGALNECVVTKSGTNVFVNTGEILISGFRIVLEQTTFPFTSLPVSLTTYRIIAEITVLSDESVTFRIFLQDLATELVQNNIFKNGYGKYQIELGRVQVNSSSVLNASRTAPLIKGGVGGGTQGSVWYQGNLVNGTGSSIYVLKSSFTSTLNINDFYLNSINGNVYQVVAISPEYYYFDYIENLKGIQGNSVFIKYSEFSDGTDFTDVWSSNQSFMGIAVAQTEPIVKSGYTWVRFNGVECEIDNSHSTITYTVSANKVKTYTSTISSATITLPSTVYFGFIAEINFKTGATAPVVSFVNNSSYNFLIMQFGASSAVYNPGANKTVSLMFYCDGLNLICYVNEV